MSLLCVEDLVVSVAGEQILNGLSLEIDPGEVHAIMGPNGSGKSTLANVLAGRPNFEVVSGRVSFNDVDLLPMAPEERAQAGLFLAFQYPVEIPGVSNMEFLKASLDHVNAARGEPPLGTVEFMKAVRKIAADLDLNPEFLKRGVNEGFSGGEKKRNEILQLLLLRPQLAVLDETDSGLDIDSLQVVARGVNGYRSDNNGMLMITHYQRLLEHIVPDVVHVLADGKIVRSGTKELALDLEAKGYAWVTP